jgi:hypothetical protein
MFSYTNYWLGKFLAHHTAKMESPGSTLWYPCMAARIICHVGWWTIPCQNTRKEHRPFTRTWSCHGLQRPGPTKDQKLPGTWMLGTLFDPCRLAYLTYTSNDSVRPPPAMNFLTKCITEICLRCKKRENRLSFPTFIPASSIWLGQKWLLAT